MRPFIHDDFLLETATARELYHEHASHLPIIDYHSHLPPVDLATNRRFANLHECWLEGDHYKWRAMRANGIAEHLITGNAPAEDKFAAWAQTVPMTYRNPLYHWTHLELARYFGITDLLDETTAPAIWEQTISLLAGDDLSTQGIAKKMKVEVICTTDDPTDLLEHHQAFVGAGTTRMLPTFRPDKAMQTDDLAAWNAWIDKLAKVSGLSIANFQDLLAALKQRHNFFHSLGGRLSDHGLNYCPAASATDHELEEIFACAREERKLTAHEAEQLATRILLETARWNHEKGWTFQLHIGALRNNNSRMLATVGRDTGFDSIGDWPHAERLAWLLDALDRDEKLPRTILYNLNPADNYVFAAMIGNFNGGTLAGKIQWGSGWWFLDQKEAIEWQLNALSNLGLLSRFVGMLTDSRSFLSFPRHEYFRRVLCNLLGREVERGEIPNDRKRLAEYVERICYRNAREYFNF